VRGLPKTPDTQTDEEVILGFWLLLEFWVVQYVPCVDTTGKHPHCQQSTMRKFSHFPFYRGFERISNPDPPCTSISISSQQTTICIIEFSSPTCLNRWRGHSSWYLALSLLLQGPREGLKVPPRKNSLWPKIKRFVRCRNLPQSFPTRVIPPSCPAHYSTNSTTSAEIKRQKKSDGTQSKSRKVLQLATNTHKQAMGARRRVTPSPTHHGRSASWRRNMIGNVNGTSRPKDGKDNPS
jgi:hypothetical protein